MEVPILLGNGNNGLLVCMDNNFYNKKTADHIFDQLQQQIGYDENSVVVLYGKEIPIPRKQTAYGDHGLCYNFSGTSVPAKPWIPLLSKIKKDVEDISGQRFNFCLVNYYADGTRYIGYHSDDEKDLGDYPCHDASNQ
jgi:DNA oxidative demethylase